MNRFGRFAVVAAAAVVMAAPALACSPMPFPPPPPAQAGTPPADVAALALVWTQAHAISRAEEDRAWRLKGQAALFDEAKSLVVVRYDREATIGKGDDAEKVAVLKPVRWVKGAAPSKANSEMQLGMSEPPPCGQMRGHAAYYGKPGDVFVVYLKGNVLRQEDMIEAYAIDRIMDPRTLAALMAQ
jgi:hypothetical protein